MLPVRKYISYLSVSVTSKIEDAHCVALDYVKVVFNNMLSQIRLSFLKVTFNSFAANFLTILISQCHIYFN